VFAARRVPVEFDARFSALRRHYAYRVTDNPFGALPLQRRDTLGWFRPLDEDPLNAASASARCWRSARAGSWSSGRCRCCA
jgi:tRNA pseudouridine38-40 synthase